MTNLKKAAASAIRAWCEKNTPAIGAIRHIHPRVYVIGKAAPLCLIIARPWQDSEPQFKDFNKQHPLQTVYAFDKGLDAGMWCAMGYVTTVGWSEMVAVPFDV